MPRSSRSALLVASPALAALAALAAACSAPGDPAADARSGTAASDFTGERGAIVGAERGVAPATIPRATCGAGPKVQLSAWALELAGDALPPLEGAELTFDVCPGYAVRTDVFGIANAQLPRGAPFTTRMRAPGHVTTIVSESVLTKDSILTDLLPTLERTDALPEYAADRPSFAVFVLPNGNGDCADERGVTLAIAEHPEARTLYMPATWPRETAPVDASATVSGGVAFFVGLASGSGERVHVIAQKPGCAVRANEAEQTGDFVLEPGAFTVGNVYVDDR